MALKLLSPELPSVKFERKDLPEGLAGDGEKVCFIKVDARAAGSINPKYLEGIETALLNATVMDEVNKENEDTEARIRASNEAAKEAARQRISALYDACVISWETNIIDADTGKPVEPTRSNFLALGDVRIPEIADAITGLEAECLEAGARMSKKDEESAKN